MTTDVESVFLDTNALVYASMSVSPLHAIACRAIEVREAVAVPL